MKKNGREIFSNFIKISTIFNNLNIEYWIIEDSQSFCACQMNAQQCKYWWLALHKNSLEYSQMEPELGTVFCFLIYPHKKIPPQIDVRKGGCPKLLKFPRGCQMNAQEVPTPSQVGWLGGSLPIQHSTIPWGLCRPGTLQCHTLKLFEVKTRLENGSPRFELIRGLFDETWGGGLQSLLYFWEWISLRKTC